MKLRLDHLAVSASSLAEGVAWAEAALGVTFATGGEHPQMGTHNRLLGLGDLYLEVIAINPAAPAPPHPRWFDLDHFTGPPRLTNWIVACDNLDTALAEGPEGCGRALPLARGDFRWRMAVPDSGRLPFDGYFPALIEWQGPAHPALRLPDSGLRLTRLDLTHPQAADLAGSLAGKMIDPRVEMSTGPQKALRATFSTPSDKERVISG